MPIFKCEKCEAVENTACCNFWTRRSNGQPLLCSECDPDIGEWHNLFEKRNYREALYVETPSGFLEPAAEE